MISINIAIFAHSKRLRLNRWVLLMLLPCVCLCPISAQDMLHFNTIGAKHTAVTQAVKVTEPYQKREGELGVETSASFRTYSRCTVSLPLKSITVNSPFGMRCDPVNRKRMRMHYGLDLKADYEEVYSMLPGVVCETGYSAGGGYFVTINHDACFCSYLHLSKIGVKEGQYVRAGQTIAISGNSGARTTGAHLHLSCRIGDEKGKFFDPMILLEFVLKRLLENN